jgi:hypothetical protein
MRSQHGAFMTMRYPLLRLKTMPKIRTASRLIGVPIFPILRRLQLKN